MVNDYFRRVEAHGLAVEQGTVVLARVVELQPGRAVGCLGQGSRMGLAEAELGKAGYLLESKRLFSSTPFRRAPPETLLQAGHRFP